MALLGPSEGPGRPNLVPTAPDWSAWVGLMFTTHFDLILAPSGNPLPSEYLRGPQKGLLGAKRALFALAPLVRDIFLFEI